MLGKGLYIKNDDFCNMVHQKRLMNRFKLLTVDKSKIKRDQQFYD
jgi:hypothetical protein